MFLEHFGLREQPFGVTPDPAYLYLGQTHRSALDSLSTGIRNDRGFMAVIAEPGMGKTTLLYHLLDQLRDNARTIFLFQTQCDSREFFGHLLSELGIDPAGMDIVAMNERLNKTLFSEMLAGRRVVLVVDEAQNLAEPVLETVRLLSNFETSHAKLLQIIFAGQPQLATKLASPALAQLRQRIAIVARLKPFRADETSAYVEHRLRVAGYSGDRIFTVDALGAIAQASNGVPRIINNLCFNAMCLACDRRLKLLDVDVVSEAVAQLRLDPVVAEASVPLPIVSRPSSSRPKLDLRPSTARILTAYRSATVRRVNKSWVYGSAALAVLIPVGVWGISRSLGRRVKAASETAETQIQRPVQQMVEPTLGGASGTVPQAITSLQFLLVSVQPNDTVKEISLRYLGRFDDEILHQISALNPELKNLDQMAAGQLLRVPFPSGTMKKVFDSDSARPSIDVGSPLQAADEIQPLPRDRTASVGVNVASSPPVGALKHAPLHAAAPEPASNVSQDAAEQAGAPNTDVSSAVSPSQPVAANALSTAQATVAALSPSAGARDPSLSANASLPPASSVQAANIEPAELISRRDPVYPMIAKSTRISGSVEIHFKISADGKVFDAAVIQGPPVLAQAALQAVQEWRYRPARRNGIPVESEATMAFDFKGN